MGGVADDGFSGQAGNDTLTGGGGSDLFLFVVGEDGHDVVTNFQPHRVGNDAFADTLRLAGFADESFEDLINNGHIFQSGSDVLISDGSKVIVTLKDVFLFNLHAADFFFTA